MDAWIQLLLDIPQIAQITQNKDLQSNPNSRESVQFDSKVVGVDREVCGAYNESIRPAPR